MDTAKSSPFHPNHHAYPDDHDINHKIKEPHAWDLQLIPTSGSKNMHDHDQHQQNPEAVELTVHLKNMGHRQMEAFS